MATPSTGKTESTGSQGRTTTFTQLQNRLQSLCQRAHVPFNAVGYYFGSALPMNGDPQVQVEQYIGRVWLWNGMIDVTSVIAPSLEGAINQALDNANVMLPQLAKSAGIIATTRGRLQTAAA
jgi:hypothetical protein